MIRVTIPSGLLLLLGCAVANPIHFPPHPEIPANWGTHSDRNLLDGECPDLQGEYLFPKTSVRISEGKTENAAPEFSEVFGLIPWHLAEKSGPAFYATTDSERLLVTQSGSESLFVIFFSIRFDETYSYEFNSSKGDFSCRSGVLTFPTKSSYGTLEGTRLNGQVNVSLQILLDGSLIAIRSSGPLKSPIEAANTEFSHEFYRFERAH